jgi:hypothetical protein
MSELRELYERGLSLGRNEAEWALYEGRGNYTEREQQLRDDAATLTQPSLAARRLRAEALGRCRGYREVIEA